MLIIGDKMNIENQKNNKYRITITYAVLIAFFFVFLVWNICAGSVDIGISEIRNIIFGRITDETMYNVIWKIRLPRIAAVVLLGGALALSGYLLQTFFNNPIAGPYILGISSGAKLMVALYMIYVVGRAKSSGAFAMVVVAFIGSMLSMAFVLLLSYKVKNAAMLIVGGVMIGYICSAITDFIVTFADESNIANLHSWSLGSFSGSNWNNVCVMSIIVITVWIITFMISKPMQAYMLGEVYAKNLGVNIRLFRILLITLSSILSACVTAFAGPISFVGIAVPHIVKWIAKTTKPIVIIPAVFIGGSVFCMFCDLIARTILSPVELNISSVTAVFGVPVVLAIMLKRKSNHD